MKITSISAQVKNPNRVNVSVDGKYRFSLDIAQVIDLGIKAGQEYDESKLQELEQESLFGKAYGRTLEYCLLRPRSAREVKDYLYRKTRNSRTKTGAVKKGWPDFIVERVFEKLSQKGYIDDENFARFWVESRNLGKGISSRKLRSELSAKGVSTATVDRILSETERTDEEELAKVISKKARLYDDRNKLVAYLARRGFSYEDIKRELDKDN